MFEIAFSVQQPGNYTHTAVPGSVILDSWVAGEYSKRKREPLQLTWILPIPVQTRYPGKSKSSVLSTVFYLTAGGSSFCGGGHPVRTLIWVWRGKKAETDRKRPCFTWERTPSNGGSCSGNTGTGRKPLQASADCPNCWVGIFTAYFNWKPTEGVFAMTFRRTIEINLSALPDPLDWQGFTGTGWCTQHLMQRLEQ